MGLRPTHRVSELVFDLLPDTAHTVVLDDQLGVGRSDGPAVEPGLEPSLSPHIA